MAITFDVGIIKKSKWSI